MTNPVPNIYNLDLNDIQTLLSSWGQPSYRAVQIWEGLYHHFWFRPEQFSSLPKSLQQQIAGYFSANTNKDEISRLRVTQVVKSSNGETIKTLFHLHDNNSIEAVLMRYANRRTLCISTQVGCGMGCVFCATGQMGFRRHLSSGEIVEQVVHYARQLSTQGEQVTNVVVMGMGEPFHNYEATLKAIDRLNHPQGYNLSARRFTISTVGIIPGIRRFTSERRQVNLAISLHASDDKLRNDLVPINKKYPLDDLFDACLEYIHTTHRRITFEWALIQDVNDLPEQANHLGQRLQQFRHGDSILCHVNIIPLNPTKQYPGKATSHQRAAAFRAALEKLFIPCTIRLRRGIDIRAGCGQLAAQSLLLDQGLS